MTDEQYLKIVAVSDLHFGNPRINAENLYKKLRKFLYPELEDTHLIFICGDIYDQLLTVNSKSHRYASQFISDLFAISAKTGMQVRILHGTFTHDRDQLSVFETLSIPKARFKIINNIECEEINEFWSSKGQINQSIKVAYLPDNLPYKKSDEAIQHLSRVMTCLGWLHVDVLVGHGTFEHVIPPESGHKPSCLYKVEQFNRIVPNGPIIMGHIHTPGRKWNVYYCGSFERMSHGEEETKGFYTFKKTSDTWSSKFIENTAAIPFISYTPEGNDGAQIVNNFLKFINDNFPDKTGFVRVLHHNPEIRSLLHKACTQNFPDIGFSSKSTGEKETSIKVDEITLDIFDDIKPSAQNLGELVYQFLDEQNITANIPKDVIVGKVNSLLEMR